MEVSKQNIHEKIRLANLESYLIMDSGPEVSFDQLTQLASAICNTPIALISFIDVDRQWFKSSVGIDLHEIPRYLSACNQTILTNDLYEIEDTVKDHSQFREYNAKEGFQFYAGVPITSSEGYNLGTLCVIDHVPRKLSDEQIQTLKVISEQITELLNIRRKYRHNLKRLIDLGEASYKSEKHYQEVAHRSATRAMAELSAGLAYRIRPHLMTIQRVDERILENDHLSSELIAQTKIIHESTEDVLNILNSLEKFIEAEQEKSMKLMDLGDALNAVINHLEWKIKKYDIKLKYHLERDLRCIGNVAQIKEVLFAVINNAIEAVAEVTIREIEITVKENNHKTTIHVKDSGKGISEDVGPFIFQPFFTTKGVSGIGIGLSLAQSILHRHSGEIRLIKPCNPTIFCLMIPTP